MSTYIISIFLTVMIVMSNLNKLMQIIKVKISLKS